MTGNSEKTEAIINRNDGKDRVNGKMLKLLKNDFLASARLIPVFYLIECAGLLCFVIGDRLDKGKLMGIGMLVSLVVAFLLIFVTFFFVVYDYHKSLFSQQGYLSFTLPVNSRQLLGSKLIIYGFWMLLSFAVMILVYYFYGRYAMNEYGDEVDMADSLLTMFTQGQYSVKFIIAYAIDIVAEFFALILSFLMLVYFAIAASNMRAFQKSNVIWAVIIFCVAVGVSLSLISLCNKFFGITLFYNLDNDAFSLCFGDPEGNGMQFNLIPFVYLAVQDIAAFFLTAYIMHKKVNIK